MSKNYIAYSRLETAEVTVENGKVSSVYLSHDEPMGKVFDVKRSEPKERFYFYLRNVFEVMILHNKKDFKELLKEIEENDSKISSYGKELLEWFESDRKKSYPKIR